MNHGALRVWPVAMVRIPGVWVARAFGLQSGKDAAVEVSSTDAVPGATEGP